jgi:hypothetical protein
VKLPYDKRRTDEDIAAAAAGVLKFDNQVPADTFKVTVDQGWVKLERDVDWQFQRYPANPIPAERTLQRWFRRAELIPAPSGRRSGPSSYHRAPQPHAVWQTDAADQVAWQNGTQVCRLRIADECSGAVLERTVFPPGVLDAVSAGRVHAVLRKVFRRWGRSQRSLGWELPSRYCARQPLATNSSARYGRRSASPTS